MGAEAEELLKHRYAIINLWRSRRMQWRCRTSANGRVISAAATRRSVAISAESERVEDPAQIGDAILRARRQNEDGKAALLEFITSQEQTFSHRRGAAE